MVGKPYTFDEEIMNFIRVVIANQFAIENSNKLDSFKELVKNESATAELTENTSYYYFKTRDALTKECIIYLVEAFDALVNGDKKIKIYLDETFYFDENEIFEKALKYTLSLPERALFHAYIRYLIIHKTDRINFFQWMRVIHNLVENSRIEDADQLINAIKSIEKLLKYSNDILKYLTNSKCNIDFFASWQIEEEILKAHLILKSENWNKLIEDYEKQGFHKGQLGYLFEFSGILNYFSISKNLHWSDEEDNTYFNKFKKYASKSVALFTIFYTDDNKDYILERALLTKGNYFIPASQNRYNIGSSKEVSNYQRDYSWKRLLRFTTEELSFWKTKRTFVKRLLDDKRFIIANIKNSLLEICEDVPDDWRSYLVQNSELISYCGQGFVRIEDDNEIELYAASQQNHYHTDMYTYNLFLKYIDNNMASFEPFQKTDNISVKSSEDYSYAKLTDWCYKKKSYCIKIYRIKGKYLIEFEKEKGNKEQTEFNEDVINVLLARKFKWESDDKAYFKWSVNESSIIYFLKNLCYDLNNLSND